MKSVSSDLKTLIEGDQFVTCYRYTLALPSGPVVRLSDGDLDVTDGTNVYSSKGPLLSRIDGTAVSHQALGLDPDTWQAVITPRSTDPLTGAANPDTLGGQPWIDAARAGALDGASILVEECYFAAWPTDTFPLAISPVGTIVDFKGFIQNVDTGNTQIALTAQDIRSKLQNDFPRRTYQSGCDYVLYGPQCTLNAATFRKTGTVGAGSTQGTILASVATPGGSGTFALGYLEMTSGANAGFKRFIRDWSAGTFTLMTPFAYPVNTGDTFNCYPGCNLTKAHCTAFGNLANYPGQPYLPAAETAI